MHARELLRPRLEISRESAHKQSVNVAVVPVLVIVFAGMPRAALAGPTLARQWRRQRIVRRPFPAAWRGIVPFAVQLEFDDPAGLRQLVSDHLYKARERRFSRR